jgi:hypothetical protein
LVFLAFSLSASISSALSLPRHRHHAFLLLGLVIILVVVLDLLLDGLLDLEEMG